MGFLAHIIEQLRDRKVERIGSGNDHRNYSNMNPQEPTAITAESRGADGAASAPLLRL